MNAHENREMQSREMTDREADELTQFEEFRDPHNLDYMTPPASAGEHLRWVATGQKNVSKERARIMSGYRPVKYGEYPNHRPFKNLIRVGTVAPEDVVTNGHDLTLMRVSQRYVESRTAYFRRQSSDLLRSATDQVPRQEPGGVLLDDGDPHIRDEKRVMGVSPPTTVERRRGRPRNASFGDA